MSCEYILVAVCQPHGHLLSLMGFGAITLAYESGASVTNWSATLGLFCPGVQAMFVGGLDRGVHSRNLAVIRWVLVRCLHVGLCSSEDPFWRGHLRGGAGKMEVRVGH